MFRTNTLILLIVVAFLNACNQPEPSPYPPISFEEISTPDGIGRATAVAFVIEDTAYIALGRNELSTKGFLKDCWALDLQTKKWTQKSDYPGIARTNAVAEVVNGKAFVGLGYYCDANDWVYTSKNFLTDWWMFDPKTGLWSQKASFPNLNGEAAASNGFASFVVGNDIVVGAGFNGYGFSKAFWKYETETDSWKRLNDFTGNARAIATATKCNDRYFFGTGYSTANENDWWEYLPATDSWKKRQQMPGNGRVNALAFAVNNRVFAGTGRTFGGTLTTGKLYADILEYDLVRNKWYERGNIPHGHRENAICFVWGKKAFIGFGENDYTVINDLWTFEP